MLKNTVGQKWRVFAFNRKTNVPVTGDALNITATLSKDWGAPVGTNDVNPTESASGGGYYYFDMLQAETNANGLDLTPISSTADVQVVDARSFSLQVTPAVVSTINQMSKETPSEWIWIDSVNGTGGGDGTIGDPVDDMTAAIALGTLVNFKYVTRGSNISADIGSVTIAAESVIELNGTFMSGVNEATWNDFCHLISSSSQSLVAFTSDVTFASGMRFQNLNFYSVFSSSLIIPVGYWDTCDFSLSGTISLTSTAAAQNIFYNCSFGNLVSGRKTIVFPGSGSATAKMFGCYGDIQIDALTTDNTIWHYGWGKLVIDSSCTGGMIQVTSHVEIFETDGTTAWDYTNTTNRPTIEVVSNSLSTIDAQTANLIPYFQLLARSDTAITTDRATQLALLNANEGSGAGDYAVTKHSQEALAVGGDSGYNPFG